MKALWLRDTISFILRLRRRAIAFAIIFGISWIRLIGRKSEIESAPSFFGNNTTFAVLMIWKFCVESSEKALMTPIRSSLMISQHERKKVIENPSGPGALSNGMSSIASLISDSEKGRSKSSKE
jgi:hypothetical protein